MKTFLFIAFLLLQAWPQDSTSILSGQNPMIKAPVDSAAIQPVAEITAFKIDSKTAFSLPSPHVGDSLDFVISLEWKDMQIPIMVLAPESLSFSGFKILGQNTQHQKLVRGENVINHTEFIYQVKAITQGAGKASSIKLRYMSPLSKNEEAIFVQPTFIDIGKQKIPFTHSWIFKIIVGLVLGVLVYFGIRMGLQKLKERKKAKTPSQKDFLPALQAIKARLLVVDSKSVIEQMEKICIDFLSEKLSLTQTGILKFEPLLLNYLPTCEDAMQSEWKELQGLFHHARFAGGQKASHEMQDYYRRLKKCLNLGDNE